MVATSSSSIVLLSELAKGRNNNCNLVRMVAALAVLLSHSFVLATGRDADQPFHVHLGGVNLGTIAVDVFFVLSGFLVCSSLINRQDLRSFIRARVLRVYPGLLVSTAITVVVLLITVGSSGMRSFLGSPQLWSFVIKNSTLIFGTQTSVPIVLDSVPYARVANGSLWTLPFEVRLYIGLGLLWYATARLGNRAKVVTLPRAVAFIALVTLSTYALTSEHTHASLRFTSFFSSGAAIYLYRDRFTIRWLWFGLCAIALTAGVTRTEWFYPAYTITLPYMIVFLAFVPIPALSSFVRSGDFSYGIYIYAFPVQQLVAKFLSPLTPLEMLAWSLPPTMALAAMSWRFVEEPALAYK